jgi:hypothetical protein
MSRHSCRAPCRHRAKSHSCRSAGHPARWPARLPGGRTMYLCFGSASLAPIQPGFRKRPSTESGLSAQTGPRDLHDWIEAKAVLLGVQRMVTVEVERDVERASRLPDYRRAVARSATCAEPSRCPNQSATLRPSVGAAAKAESVHLRRPSGRSGTRGATSAAMSTSSATSGPAYRQTR